MTGREPTSYEQYRALWRDAFIEKGHTFIRDEDGDIDDWVVSQNYCNGPGCSTCGWSCCHHCVPLEKIPECTAKENTNG